MQKVAHPLYDQEAVGWIERNLTVLEDACLDRRFTLRQVVQAFVAGRRSGRCGDPDEGTARQAA